MNSAARSVGCNEPLGGTELEKKMRAFEHFNSNHGAICPVCKTSKDCETVLVPIPDTEDNGICEAIQVHKKCYDLVIEMSDEATPNAR